MKKYKTDLIVILSVSVFFSLLLPGYFKNAVTIVLPDAVEFIAGTLILFVLLLLAYFAVKPGLDNETKKNMKAVPSGYQELYNENNHITKKGTFECGKLYNGLSYVYRKDGTLSHIEIYRKGVYSGDAPANK
jgi:hypothetical protein